MSLLHDIKQKVNQRPILQYLYDISKWIVNIMPFYLVEEGLFNNDDLRFRPAIDLEKCKVDFLQAPDMKAISKSSEVKETEEVLLQRLSDGLICIGMKYNTDIVGYMWCNLRECDSRLLSFKLENHEAYLTDARTFLAYRGMKIAPYLRYQLYKKLQEIGRIKLFSITEYFNAPAIKFKKKLQVRPIKFYLWVCFAKRIKFNIILKSYQP